MYNTATHIHTYTYNKQIITQLMHLHHQIQGYYPGLYTRYNMHNPTLTMAYVTPKNELRIFYAYQKHKVL